MAGCALKDSNQVEVQQVVTVSGGPESVFSAFAPAGVGLANNPPCPWSPTQCPDLTTEDARVFLSPPHRASTIGSQRISRLDGLFRQTVIALQSPTLRITKAASPFPDWRLDARTTQSRLTPRDSGLRPPTCDVATGDRRSHTDRNRADRVSWARESPRRSSR